MPEPEWGTLSNTHIAAKVDALAKEADEVAQHLEVKVLEQLETLSGMLSALEVSKSEVMKATKGTTT